MNLAAEGTPGEIIGRNGLRPSPLKSRLLWWTILAWIFLIPVTAIMQSFLPESIKFVVLYSRMLLLPVLVLLFQREEIHWTSFLALVLFSLANGFSAMMTRPQLFALDFISLFGGILLFRAGRALGGDSRFSAGWEALVWGVAAVNALTLLIFAGIYYGYLPMEPIFFLLQKDTYFGLDRFTLGNAIEVPFVMTALLYAGTRSATKGRIHFLHVILNLVTAIMSQSRVVMLAALFVFLEQWVNCSRRHKAISLAAILVGLVVVWENVFDTFYSIVSRFGGRDYGSTEDRAIMLRMVLQEIEVPGLILGKGLTGGAALIQQRTGMYRTVESVVVALLFELGLVGCGLLLVTLVAGKRRLSWFEPGIHPATWLLWAELLLFMPIFPLMPLVMFALGALAVQHNSKSRAEDRRPDQAESRGGPSVGSLPLDESRNQGMG